MPQVCLSLSSEYRLDGSRSNGNDWGMAFDNHGMQSLLMQVTQVVGSIFLCGK